MRHLDWVALTVGALCFYIEGRAETRISGPYTHQNLSLFLLHQNPATPAPRQTYLSLQKAMEQKKVVVYETQQVNQLSVENTSDQPVFIQRGDMVKGGQQDRMITNDFVLPPRSGRIPLQAFCVEQDRWSGRGKEDAGTFESSTGLAAVAFDPRAMWNQMSVWGAVRELKTSLVRTLNTPQAHKALSSTSSLGVAQTIPQTEEAVSAYTKALATLVTDKKDVVGYAFAVNGVLKSADVYASPALFSSMREKVLKAIAVEAIRLRGDARKLPVVQVSQVSVFLRSAALGKETVTNVYGSISLLKREGVNEYSVESRDGLNFVHRSVMKK